MGGTLSSPVPESTPRSPRSRPPTRSAPASRAARGPSRPRAGGGARSPWSPRPPLAGASAKSAGSSPHAAQTIRASSATVSSRAAEMLKSSPSPRGEPSAVTIPSAMSSTWVGVRVCSPEPRMRSGRCPERTCAIRSSTASVVRDLAPDARSDAGLAGRGPAGAVGIAWPADRVLQAVLVVCRAAVDLAGELREAGGRQRRRAVRQVGLGRRELAGAFEHQRGGDVREALHVELERRANHRVVERVVDLDERVRQALQTGPGRSAPALAPRWITCEQPAVARLAWSSTRRSPAWTSQPSRIHRGTGRCSETRTS